MSEAIPLDKQVIFRQSCFQRVRIWWRGIHPSKGTIIQGYTGWETVEERDRIMPSRTFTVRGS